MFRAYEYVDDLKTMYSAQKLDKSEAKMSLLHYVRIS